MLSTKVCPTGRWWWWRFSAFHDVQEELDRMECDDE